MATTTPMATVAPVAARAAMRVRNRREELARRRVSGEWDCRLDFIDHFLGSGSHMEAAADTANLEFFCARSVKVPGVLLGVVGAEGHGIHFGQRRSWHQTAKPVGRGSPPIRHLHRQRTE